MGEKGTKGIVFLGDSTYHDSLGKKEGGGKEFVSPWGEGKKGGGK